MMTQTVRKHRAPCCARTHARSPYGDRALRHTARICPITAQGTRSGTAHQ